MMILLANGLYRLHNAHTEITKHVCRRGVVPLRHLRHVPPPLKQCGDFG